MTAVRLDPDVSSPLVRRCYICDNAFDSRNRLFDHLAAEHRYLRDDEEEDIEDPANRGPARERTAASIAARSTYENCHHDAYYRRQCQAGVMSLEDWEEACRYFRKPLRVAFRQTLVPPHQHHAREAYLRYVVQAEEVGNPHLTSSPYFAPETCRIARRPPREWSFAAQQALRDAQDVGALNRQELCSMIPPILLLHEGDDDGEADHTTADATASTTILDLCAAPGSKSLQLLDIWNRRASEASTTTDVPCSVRPGGGGLLLVANDPNRSRLLTVACRARVTAAIPGKAGLVLSASDGRYFPALRKGYRGYKVKFTKVLADVPCSGDGTFRKLSSNEWKSWNVQHHLTLHKLQLKLLIRSLELVQKGGRVVYSTCSLDPIENEAVVASAIARMGGPSVYRIVPPPRRLQQGATHDFPYSPGATSWVVPDPHFQADHPVVYERHDHVPPKKLHRKRVVPSMFPPSTKRVSDWVYQEHKDHGNAPVTDDAKTSGKKDAKTNYISSLEDRRQAKLEQLRYYGDLISDEDAAQLEAMLPKCCRILPQHLDSGGFFCAIIQRVRPEYFAICCPSQRALDHPTNPYHGCIYHVVPPASSTPSRVKAGDGDDQDDTDSSLPMTTIRRQLRHLLATEKGEGKNVYFEGLPTMETAQQWLRRHSAYIDGRSEMALPLPEMAKLPHPSDSSTPISVKKEWTPSNHCTPLFTPLFAKPHPDLIAEFVDFFGLAVSMEDATNAGVERFPTEQLIIIGGGEAALQVKTCMKATDAFVENEDKNDDDETEGRWIKRKCFRLTLASKDIQSLYSGGAKFNPMEVGLTICFVPVPCQGLRRKAFSLDGIEDTMDDKGSTTSPAETNGRYGLLDEAAEWVGRCATKRILALTRADCIQLLKSSNLDMKCLEEEYVPPTNSGWWTKWGKLSVSHQEVVSIPDGAMIVVCPASNERDLLSTMYLPCSLRGDALQLLTKQRLANGWLRLLQWTESK